MKPCHGLWKRQLYIRWCATWCFSFHILYIVAYYLVRSFLVQYETGPYSCLRSFWLLWIRAVNQNLANTQVSLATLAFPQECTTSFEGCCNLKSIQIHSTAVLLCDIVVNPPILFCQGVGAELRERRQLLQYTFKVSSYGLPGGSWFHIFAYK
jgi:hypothetical protein